MKKEAKKTSISDIPVVVADEQKLNAHTPTRERLEGIADPLERLVEASQIARTCYRQHPEMIALRQRRRVAVVAMFRFHGWNKAEIARFIGGQKQDRRVVDFAFGLVDLRDIPEEFGDEAVASQAAKEVHEAYVEREQMGTTTREMRRVLIWELTTGRYGRRHRNAELADLIGNTPALVAQNRTGSSNRAKKEARAAAAADKQRKGGDGVAA